MTDELLPCPFCGAPGPVLHNSKNLTASWMSCQGCGLETPTETGVSASDAVAYWNRRAQPVRVKDDIEREAEINARSKLRSAFRKALADLPEIAPAEIASVLSSVHMRDEFFAEGKRLQSEHGTDLVAPRVEQECGAGAWSLMRKGILSALEPAPVVITDEMMERACRRMHPTWDEAMTPSDHRWYKNVARAALQAALTPNGGSGDE